MSRFLTGPGARAEGDPFTRVRGGGARERRGVAWCLTPEMEFLDINLTKGSSLLLHAIHSLSTSGFLNKTPDSTLVLKIHVKKIRDTTKLKSICK